VQAFHAGLPSREEKKDVEAATNPEGKIILTPGYLVRALGLDDWRRALPVGVMFAIPAIVKEWVILDEEAMLIGVFLLFFGTIHQQFGDSIGAYFDKQTDDWLAWRNAAEDAETDKVKEGLEWHKVRMSQLQIAKDLIALQKETMVKEAHNQTAAQPHVTRETTLQMLDSAVAQESTEWNNAQNALVDEAIRTVTSQVQNDAALKKTALNEALAALASPGKEQGTDAVSKMFAQFFQDKRKEAEKVASQEHTTTPEEIKALSDTVDAFCARYPNVKGIEEYRTKAKQLIPRKYKGSLQRAFLMAQAKAMK
jgi:hypothetical protein